MYSMYCGTVNNPLHNLNNIILLVLFCKALILKGLYVNFTIFTVIMIQASGFFFNSLTVNEVMKVKKRAHLHGPQIWTTQARHN